MPTPEIPPDYYWRHFRTVVETVLEHHGHLYAAAEREAIEALLALPRPAQMLFVRLLTRKGTLFRRSRLRYAEIGDVDGAIAALIAAGFAAADPQDALADGSALALLTVPELRGIARRLGCPATAARKDALLDALADTDAETRRAALGEVERFVQLCGDGPFLLAQVLFFGNRRQDQSEFVLVDLERSAYEDYPLDRAAPLFPDRADLDGYLDSAARWEEGWTAREEGDRDRLTGLGVQALESLATRPELPPHRRRVDPARYDERLALLAARELERAGDPEEACAFYAELLGRGRGPARAAEAADRWGLAARRAGLDPAPLDELVAPWLASPRLDDISRHRIALRRFRLGLGPDPRAALRRPPVIELALEPAGYRGPKALYRVGEEGWPVEQAVLDALGGDGLWCENALFATLFGLLLWDVVFAPLPGMFQHPFQDAPLDFATGDFRVHRAGLFAARLDALRGGDRVAELRRAHAAHAGKRCRGVVWEGLAPDVLARAVDSLGPSLLPVLERLGRHPRRHRRGMPDLALWRAGALQLVEVKGPGDQLSVEQALWHDALLRAGVDVRLARVRRLPASAGDPG